MLGPVHPYDREDGYVPADRFATRPVVWAGDPIADGPDNVGDQSWLARAGSRAGSWRARRRVAPVPRREAAPAPMPPHASAPAPTKPTVVSNGVSKSAAKKARRKRAAQGLGISVSDLAVLRQRVATAEAEAARVGTRRRQGVAAKRLGLTEFELTSLKRALSGSPSLGAKLTARRVLGRNEAPTPPKKKVAMPIRRSMDSGDGRRVPHCTACDRPISVNGMCGCS
jgi:hypothetical protein